ncbi:CHASE2 domain-containing protein [Chamaesiphon sp. OTE_8_metabat_110]|uniref:CHASE2 domain-containing protein n=1 Tax=Chamaesiphon sp. OTE_8_metabat_110 TaxID=2964696 RepID=UPI00286AA6FB|nr:CHASE2 domain-containing protein [Chamaesiphon sp. OTE_8_metabat_110]
MSIALFLSLGAGSLSSGFDRINSRLEVDNQLVGQLQGSLPGNPELQTLYYQWQFFYAAYYDNYLHAVRGEPPKIELDTTGVTGFSVTSFAQTRAKLEAEMLAWLDTSAFSALAEPLLWRIGNAAAPERSRPTEAIIIIESADDRIYRLPWHCWSALAHCPQAEITFSLNTYQRKLSTSDRTKPRILAVFGDRTGIDTMTDAACIQRLPADLVTLVEPSIAQLRSQLHDRQGWDILFFAGHGSDLETGTIHLNPRETIALKDISDAIAIAIECGLKLAIFNCCSGLGVAASLAALDIPTAIVMREAIPNRVAQDFLQTFLYSFESGNSLLVAVADARRRLKAIETDFPCATWLPVVFWNPTVPLPTWKSFYPQPIARMSLWKLGAIVLATTAAIWGVRSQGYLEPIELATYDLTLNARSSELPDDRLVIVGIDRTKPVSDRVLVQALTKLQEYSPQTIGLDIYRDIPMGEGHDDLTKLLQQESIVSSCLMSGNSKKSPGVAAPEGVKPTRVGFTNFSLDPDGTIRRQVLGMAASDRGCSTDHALSLRLALKYLNIAEADEADNGNIKIGTHEIPVLNHSFGGYRSTQSGDNLRGFQVMLNYRNAAQIAPQVSLEDVLTDRVTREAIAGKAVLIGYVGRNSGDTFASLGKTAQLPGVSIHAQMTSNILSHILDGRASITTWSDLAEFGWILMWGTASGMSWLWLTGAGRWLAPVGAIVVVVATCELYLDTRSVWIPLIPAVVVIAIVPVVASGVEWQSSIDWQS